ncbi:hypothetical protein [Nocardioides acrostichi]|uniref:Uncharacterized protein n=1 Tax=Nocardioides acrostichi TaxID=2784339 RepID=A0A930UVS3_9ACTN|nr:hypothetical protein [Nocardioides acrostichi]MBF4161773.1 hypothetical protein [Nocardioides acrostichi]
MLAQLRFLVLMLHVRIARARRAERGASMVEWVIITAILAALALSVGYLIVDKISSKASTINLDK